MKIKGLDELSKNLEKSIKRVEDFGDEQRVQFQDLFTNSFVKANTKFHNASEFLNALPDDDSQWDDFAKSYTKYHNWEDLLGKAGTEYVANHLFGDL